MNLLFVCYSRSSFSMSGTHFYFTLPSNASSDVNPDNKIGSYYVKFPQTIDLNGEWEVGLYSITYFYTWYTLQNHQNHIYYSLDGGKTFWSSAIVDYGYYTTMPELIESMNVAMKKELWNTNITFSFNPRTHKVGVALAAKHCVGLYGQLAKMLGFKKEISRSENRKKVPTCPICMISHPFLFIAILFNRKSSETRAFLC